MDDLIKNVVKKKKKSKNKKSKVLKNSIPIKEKSKFPFRPITNPKLSNGASNWAQLLKATDINGKKKDLSQVKSYTNLKNPPNTSSNKRKSNFCRRNDVLKKRTPETCNNASKNGNLGKISRGADVSSNNTSHNSVTDSHIAKAPMNNFKFNFKEKPISSGSEVTAVARNSKELTKYIGMDCEMVGTGENGRESILARVSLVNSHGECVYDEHVKPIEPVTDYRTRVSGVRPADLEKGKSMFEVQTDVARIVKDRIIVGHSLENDFKVLFLKHPHSKIRDTSHYAPLKRITKGRTPSLKKLAASVLGIHIQKGEHDSVQDARAAMHIFLRKRREWDRLTNRKRYAHEKT